ncbi:Protein transport protein S9 plasma membrane t-SNARE [Apophysomyces ossiformis]|uniref:Protein transport protein S9 plasma membrane t-SNARE n=1 Tax=Apophysomyces ossiformis TaxID=679940 RepID=A0A8H7BZL4_9FUNG|nr:Protein transport protein S9 plasma membrane t-SNARE [Apophysomyces ossiformis]
MFWQKKTKDTKAVTVEQPYRDDKNPFSSAVENEFAPERPIEDRARQELFRTRPKFDQQGQEDAYASSRFAKSEEEQEVDRLKEQIHNVRMDTLESTRNTLQRLREAEGAAEKTLCMLGEQAEQVAHVHRQMHLAKEQSDRAAVQANELKQLNRSIFIPKNPFRSKKKKSEKELEMLRQELADQTAERDKIRQFEYQSRTRLEVAQRHAENASVQAKYGDPSRTAAAAKEEEKHRYQFEPTIDDEAAEDEIAQNVDAFSDILSNLHHHAKVMGTEIESQTNQLTKLTKKVNPITEKLTTTTHTLDNTR